ncbi:MAG: carbamoyl-phosphate synthase large subunit, partial [Bacilli bacterium]
ASINEPTIESRIATTIEECLKYANEIGYPIVLRPAFTLGGTGGGFVYNDEQTKSLGANALNLSPAHQVLVEKSLLGYQEVEFEVMRDKNDHAIIICDMENIDPVGVHTGDSSVVAPCLTLPQETIDIMAHSAKKIIRTLKIEGVCNVQYALKPQTNEYYLIEVNPRVSRSSALASKATSYPIAYVTSKLAIGYTLDEITIIDSKASIEPKVNYNVVKISRFPFDKFKNADRKLSTQMKATGEIMALGSSFEEAFLKAIRSLENGYDYLDYQPQDHEDLKSLLKRIEEADDERLYIIGYLLRNKVSVKQIVTATKITYEFIDRISKIIAFEQELKLDSKTIRKAKQLGFSDKVIALFLKMTPYDIRAFRLENNIIPNFKNVDAMAINEEVSYLYSTYATPPKPLIESNKDKVLIIGSGPIRIGQGIEFDYSTVHCIKTIKELGIEAIVINNNPETVSTDYTISDKLYFEPITFEEVMNIIDIEKPQGVIVQLGGQTAINLTRALSDAQINILGTSADAIDLAENRDLFEKLLEDNNIKQPLGQAITKVSAGQAIAHKIGYPVLVRPSFVLGGQSMRIVNDDIALQAYLSDMKEISTTKPILIDKYIKGKEVELDAICDGYEVFIPGIMEHIERTGVHSGDSISVYPHFSLSEKVITKIIDITTKVGLALKTVGLFNI